MKKNLTIDILFICAVFTILLNFGLPIYWEYFDSADYYIVESPIQVEPDTVKACETINLVYAREAKIDLTTITDRKIIHVGSGTNKVYTLSQVPGLILKSEKKTVSIAFTIPCQVETGKYRIEGITTFNVYSSVKKIESWYTEEFEVI